uniref:BLVR domain-containing protein n=1 Tax=Steinernema glaseri TaxID=37863 RepID=A0A1I7ZLI8_9BILA
MAKKSISAIGDLLRSGASGKKVGVSKLLTTGVSSLLTDEIQYDREAEPFLSTEVDLSKVIVLEPSTPTQKEIQKHAPKRKCINFSHRQWENRKKGAKKDTDKGEQKEKDGEAGKTKSKATAPLKEKKGPRKTVPSIKKKLLKPKKAVKEA